MPGAWIQAAKHNDSPDCFADRSAGVTQLEAFGDDGCAERHPGVSVSVMAAAMRGAWLMGMPGMVYALLSFTPWLMKHFTSRPSDAS